MSQAHALASLGACASCMARAQNLMSVTMPQFAHKDGQIYMASRSIEHLFINRALQMDC